MPRIAEPREAAEPHSVQQKDRYRRILRAAARLGSENELERVQMLDVARDAGVALATLYRYFPSKTHLFTSVMASQIDRLAQGVHPPRPGQDPVDNVVAVFVRATRVMLSRPLLASAILQSNNAAHAGAVPVASQNAASTRDVMLTALGVDDPTPHDVTLVRLLVQCWYGSLVQAIHGQLTVDDVGRDVDVAARLLLAGRSTAPG